MPLGSPYGTFYYMSLRGLSTGALHPGSPPAAPVERDAPFLKAFLDMSLGVPSKGAPAPPGSPYRVSLYRERCSIFRAFFYMSFIVPSQKDLPPGYPRRAPIEMLHCQSLLSPVKVPSKGAPPLQVPPVFPYASFQSLLLHIFPRPQ